MPIFLYILIIAAIVCFSIYGWWYNTPKNKGKRGEEEIFNILMQLPDEYHLMNDVILQTNNGTTQIDHVVISRYGVFVIETKNYRGNIYGDDNRQNWKQNIVTKVTYAKKWWKTYTYVTQNELYNPVKQSLGHSKAISRNLTKWPHLKVIPIVVFTSRANLQYVKSNYHVVYDYQLLSTILSYQTVYLNDNEVQDVANWLYHVDVREFVDDNTHVRNVRLAKMQQTSKIASGICPRCGGTLVLRSGRYGTFYGCSNYPTCKFTTK